MPQSFSGIYVHLVFSTLRRNPFLSDDDIRNAAHSYLGGVSRNAECQTLIVGGAYDHVHLLARLSRTITIADWVKELKRSSSLWVKTQGVHDFAWQAGYGAFSVGLEQLPTLKNYIADQVEHHRTRSFEEEYREILTLAGLEWDEKYVWD